MANVINRVTLEQKQSVNTPDYPTQDWIVNPDYSSVNGVPKKYWKINGDAIVEMSQPEKDAVEAALAPTAEQQAALVIDNAKKFAKKAEDDFIAENLILGITPLGLTNHVRKTLREVGDALRTGSLYDAIYEISVVSNTTFDPVILTAARLLAFRNKIEEYLGLTLATSYNDPVS